MKKSMLQRVVSLLVTVCLAIGLLPTVSFASSDRTGPNPDATTQADTAHIYMCDSSTKQVEKILYIQVDGVSIDAVEGMIYDKNTNTLSLSDFDGTGKYLQINEMGSDFQIYLEGESTFDAIISWGYGYEASLNITGSGILNVNPTGNVSIYSRQGIFIEAEGAPAVLKVASESTVNVFGSNGEPAVTINETSTSSDAIIAQGKLSSGQPVQVQEHIQRKRQKYCNATDDFNYPLYTYNGDYYGYRIVSIIDENLNVTNGYTMYSITGNDTDGYTATIIEAEAELAEVPEKYEIVYVYSDYYYYCYTISSDSTFENALSEVHFVPNGTSEPEKTKPTITTTSLPDGKINTAYSAKLEATPGTAGKAVTWSVSVGELPAGLTLDSATGVISGTPTTVGSQSFTVSAAEEDGLSSAVRLSIKINNSEVSFDNDYDIYLSTNEEGAVIAESKFSCFAYLSRELDETEAAGVTAELYYNGNAVPTTLPVQINKAMLYTSAEFPADMTSVEKIVYKIGALTKEIVINKPVAPVLNIVPTGAADYARLVIKDSNDDTVFEIWDNFALTLDFLDEGTYTVDIIKEIDGRGVYSLIGGEKSVTLTDGAVQTLNVTITDKDSKYATASVTAEGSNLSYYECDIFWYVDAAGTQLLSQNRSVRLIEGETLYVKAVPKGYYATLYGESALIPVTDTESVDITLPRLPRITVTGTVRYTNPDGSTEICSYESVSGYISGDGSSSRSIMERTDSNGRFSLSDVTAGTVITISRYSALSEQYSYTVTADDIARGSLNLDVTLGLANGFIYLPECYKSDYEKDTFSKWNDVRLYAEDCTITKNGEKLFFSTYYNGLLLDDPSLVSAGDKLLLTFDDGNSYGSATITIYSDNGQILGVAEPLYATYRGRAIIQVSRKLALNYSVLLYHPSGKLIETRRGAIGNSLTANEYFDYLDAGNYTAVFIETSYFDSLEAGSYSTIAQANALSSDYTAKVPFTLTDNEWTEKSIVVPTNAYAKGTFNEAATGVTMKQTYPETVDIDVVCTPAADFKMYDNSSVTLKIITNQNGQTAGNFISTRSLAINGHSLDANRWNQVTNGGIIKEDGSITLTLSAEQLKKYGGFPLSFSTTVVMTNPLEFNAVATLTYRDENNRERTNFVGIYEEQRGELSLNVPALTADGSFTVYGVGPASTKEKPYNVTVYANGAPIATVNTDTNLGYFKAKISIDENDLDEYETISFTAKGAFSDGSGAAESSVEETLYSSGMGALVKNELYWDYLFGSMKSIVVWDDGDPVNVNTSYYIPAQRMETGYQWKLTFDNPDKVYDVTVSYLKNGEVVDIPATRVSGTDYFMTEKVYLYGATPDGAWVSYMHKDDVYMKPSDDTDISDEEFAEVCDYLNGLSSFSEFQGTPDDFSFVLEAGEEKVGIICFNEDVAWDNAKIDEFESMPEDELLPFVICYEQGYLPQTNGVFALRTVMKCINSDYPSEYFYVEVLYTLATRTTTVWDTQTQTAYKTVVQIGNDPTLQPEEYAEQEAQDAEYNRVSDVLTVWDGFIFLVSEGLNEASSNTVSVTRLMGAPGNVTSGLKYLPNVFQWMVDNKYGKPITTEEIAKIFTFYKDNEACFKYVIANLESANRPDYQPDVDPLLDYLKEIRDIPENFGKLTTWSMAMLGYKSVTNIPGGVRSVVLSCFSDPLLKYGKKDLLAQADKINTQAQALAYDLYYAAQYLQGLGQYKEYCYKFSWKNFPYEFFNPNVNIHKRTKYRGKTYQRMPSGPRGKLDPSGVIYEAVESNVIDGAAATLYYFDGSNGVAADSTYFGIEPNPQTVGENGFYQWFVPVGNWRVVASKDGYTTVDTGSSADYGLNAAQQADGYYYMPVLPVQLDVNIGLVSYEAPKVESINATTDGVFITFSKYMSEGELTAANIGLYVNDTLVTLNSSNVILADSEKVNADSTISYTKTVKLAYPGLTTSDKVQVVINTNVKSYAGVHMAERYDSGVMDVTEPAQAAAPIASVRGGEVEKNTAVKLTSDTAGAVIYYTTDGTEPTTSSAVYSGAILIGESVTIKAIAVKLGMRNSDVLTVNYTVIEEAPAEDSDRPEKVVATMNGKVITDNSTVSAGYLKFETATEGAKIYYTTNGNCPIADIENRIEYTRPIYLEAGKTYYFRVRAYNGTYSEGLPLHITVKSGSSGGSGGGGYRPTTPTESKNPSIGGSAKSWSDIAAELAKLTNGSEVTIELNGNTTVPVEVIKVIDERDLKVTFVVDSVKSWKTDGAEITTPAAADLSILTSSKLKTDDLRGILGIQFTINTTNNPTDLEIAFKTEHAGKFANLYKDVDGKLVFVTCAKLGTDGKVILPDVVEKGDYVVMLCEFSDRPGDMNNDGVLDIFDAAAILKDIVGLEKGANPLMADFDGDGEITVFDASAILKRLVGLA
ncbi:MAG: chitobiase/beta-hexosaminidase C-terminal domain-containing protein [Oscillospiraceae bacterium]|nr:chitobiase/beta-hexosaminidase C-terminal domain-containing protein [Oscillospiraceae bacterium]